MKMKKMIPIILIIALILTFTPAIPVMAASGLHKVTGGGTVNFWGYKEFKETYGFTATQLDESGNAKGNMQIVWHYEIYPDAMSPLVLHADVLYLAVDDDTGDAWIGGVVTESNDYGWVGTEFYIQVQDNGEGGKASAPDMIGYTYFGPGWAKKALNKWSGDMFEFNNGNVNVK
ncbi:hypothetical protein ACFLWK_01535 [Chloroflexota bacterium]